MNNYTFQSRALLSTRRITITAESESDATRAAAHRLFPETWEDVELVSRGLHLYRVGENQMVMVGINETNSRFS